IISGIVAKKFLQSDQIYVTNRENQDRLSQVEELFGVHCSRNKQEVIEGADVILLSMKPKDVTDALQSIKVYVRENQLVISVLAGVSTDYISDQLGHCTPVV